MKKITLAVLAGLVLVAAVLMLSRWSAAPASTVREETLPFQEQKLEDNSVGVEERAQIQPMTKPVAMPQALEQPEPTQIQAADPVEAPKEPEAPQAPKELGNQANPYLRSPWAMLGLLRRMETALQNNFAEEMEGLESLIALREDLTFEIEENADLGRPNPPELAEEFAEMEEEERALMQELAARPELQKYFSYSDVQN